MAEVGEVREAQGQLLLIKPPPTPRPHHLGHRERLRERALNGGLAALPDYEALELSACAVILVHNHPSGDPTPSQADVEMTRQVIAAARTLNIAVHDHLVVGREGVASFKALGLI